MFIYDRTISIKNIVDWATKDFENIIDEFFCTHLLMEDLKEIYLDDDWWNYPTYSPQERKEKLEYIAEKVCDDFIQDKLLLNKQLIY